MSANEVAPDYHLPRRFKATGHLALFDRAQSSSKENGQAVEIVWDCPLSKLDGVAEGMPSCNHHYFSHYFAQTLSSSTSSTTKFSKDISARKRRKVDTDAQIAGPSQPPNRFILPPPAEPTKKNGESVELLQKMVRGEMVYTPTQET